MPKGPMPAVVKAFETISTAKVSKSAAEARELMFLREGDRIVVRPGGPDPRRGDRVVVRTAAGEVMAKEVARITRDRLELKSLNPDHPGRVLRRDEIAWIARIIWASQ